MITKRTVFVLGAGANVPYGFPSGEGLRDRILDLGDPLLKENQEALSQTGLTRDELQPFFDTLANASTPSVDAFLEQRTEFRDVGMRLIAYFLLKAEAKHRTCKGDDWRHYLFADIFEGAKEAKDFEPGKVAFVTFNYDRSLTDFLLRKLVAYFGIDDGAAAKVISERLPIYHVHGSLGGDPWESPYGQVLTPGLVEKAAQSIKIIDNPDTEPFASARKLLASAEHVFFLGFGFHQRNVERLGFPLNKRNPNLAGPYVSGTALNVPQARIKRFAVKWKLNSLGPPSYEIKQFLNEDDRYVGSLG